MNGVRIPFMISCGLSLNWVIRGLGTYLCGLTSYSTAWLWFASVGIIERVSSGLKFGGDRSYS